MAGGFLSRWARLKAENASPQAPEAAPADEAAPVPAPMPEGDAVPDGEAGATAESEEEPFDLEALPDVESLTAESDFSMFMDARVPDELRSRALRKLWTSDPIYAVRDGLNDYDGDYGPASLVGQAVRTVYDAVRGYDFGPEEAETPAQAPPQDGAQLVANETAEGEEGTPGEGQADEEFAAQTDSEEGNEKTG